MAENLTPVQDDKLKEQQVDKLKRLRAAKLERQQANRRMKSLLKKSHEFAVPKSPYLSRIRRVSFTLISP